MHLIELYSLLFTVDIDFEGNIAQPGSVVLINDRSCIPGECGDASTTFDLVIGGILLERLSTQNTTVQYAGRFPNFPGTMFSAEVTVVTQYQEFRLRQFFNLFQPQAITSVTPDTGQGGTNVIMQLQARDESIFRAGHSVVISRVRLGENEANIIDTSVSTTLLVRARSGVAGTGSISINSTDTFDNVVYDGPYLYLEDGWTQLEDGNITEIVPPAAQLGRSIFICGNDLLGNGTAISTIQHGSNVLFGLQASPSPSTPTQPGSECLEVEVPVAAEDGNESTVVITSNTGAIVMSASNFAISSVNSVTPSRGQAGTVVTIGGQALLSGYPSSVKPTVFLSDVFAVVLEWCESQIVVQAGTPPTFPPVVINATTGATAPPPQIIGVMGGVLIEVPNPFDSNLRFNVSNDTGWQYEELGVVDIVTPNFGQYGTIVTINGSNLLAYGDALTHATIGDINATILDGASNGLVQLVVPDTNTTGIVDITLFSDTGANVRGSRIFLYMERGIVSAALPSRGQNGTIGKIYSCNVQS